MKKINLNAISKRKLIAGGSVLVGITLVITGLAFNTAAKVPESNSVESSSSVAPTSTEVFVDDIKAIDSTSSTEEIFTPSSGVSQSSELTQIKKPTSNPPKPVVQGDASTASNGKKTQPTNSALTNKNQKPSYASKPTATTSKPSTGGKTTSSPSSSTPKAGDSHDGKSYVPGFGWVDGTGAGGQGTVVSGMKEDGNKVGIMD